jgi:hypothetical protein
MGAAVKLLPCDCEVMCSSLENNLLQKCRKILHTQDTKWSDPSRDLVQTRAMYTGLPFNVRVPKNCVLKLKENKSLKFLASLRRKIAKLYSQAFG